MNLTLEIPDDLAGQMGTERDLSRRALELLALEEYKSGHLTETELQRLLGFGTRHKLDGSLTICARSRDPRASGILRGETVIATPARLTISY